MPIYILFTILLFAVCMNTCLKSKAYAAPFELPVSPIPAPTQSDSPGPVHPFVLLCKRRQAGTSLYSICPGWKGAQRALSEAEVQTSQQSNEQSTAPHYHLNYTGMAQGAATVNPRSLLTHSYRLPQSSPQGKHGDKETAPRGHAHKAKEGGQGVAKCMTRIQ